MGKATVVTAVAVSVSEVAAWDVRRRAAVVSFSFTSSAGSVSFTFTVATFAARVAGGASVGVVAGLAAGVADHVFYGDHCWVGTRVRQRGWEWLEIRGCRVLGSFNRETAKLGVVGKEFIVHEDGQFHLLFHSAWQSLDVAL